MTILVEEASAAYRTEQARIAFRTLLVHVQPEASAEPRLAAAVALARRLNAHLTGVGAEMLQPVAFTDPHGVIQGEWLVETRKILEENLDKAEAKFRHAAKELNVEWFRLEEFPIPAMAALSRRADLVIAGGSTDGDHSGYRWCDPAELTLKCGRPVLLVPPHGGELQAGNIVIGWKETREARRAVADAMPFLVGAKDVEVVEVCGPDEVLEAKMHTDAVVQHLRRHGVAARAKVVVASPAAVATVLSREANDIGADLIVTGAYGHTRLGEWVFGGATHDLLQDPEQFLLMSH
jgi:nucleotide-binding universal stress UspA family protein